MKTVNIKISGCRISQKLAQEIGESIAKQDNPDTMVISRYNRSTNACSPCCLKENIGGKPGWEIYGENHGGQLKITFNRDDYIFIFN